MVALLPEFVRQPRPWSINLVAPEAPLVELAELLLVALLGCAGVDKGVGAEEGVRAHVGDRKRPRRVGELLHFQGFETQSHLLADSEEEALGRVGCKDTRRRRPESNEAA
eukprot:6104123-Pleurochrysis_carterae.AAC.2